MYLMQNRRAMNRERIFRDRTNPLELGDNEIIARYRLPRAEILDICDLLRPDLERDTLRTNALSVSTQVFATLRYLSTGSFQQVTGDLHGISKSSVCRSIHAMCNAMCRHTDQYIRFPRTRQELRGTKQEFFFALAGFPGAVGAIDGTLIPINRPHEEHLYVCRKGYHAINVQAVCDASLK